MHRIFKDGKLYHCYFNAADYTAGRMDATDPEEYLQCAIINMDKGKKFDPHVHIPCERITDTTQEAWVVLKGKIQVTYYDEDCQVMHEDAVISAGGCTMSFWGGHKYQCLEDETVVYEFKSGPYFGKEADKRVFND
jgi:cupin fold WbuC family metalloprotein